jgi:hypothetical protein
MGVKNRKKHAGKGNNQRGCVIRKGKRFRKQMVGRGQL